MDVTEIIRKLRFRLKDYCQSDSYKLNGYSKDIVSAAEIAANLVAIAQRNSSKIREEDKMWFKGTYQVSRHFDDPPWDDIGRLYAELVEAAKAYFLNVDGL